MDKLDSYHLPVTGRNILRFAFPTIVMTVFNTFYTMVDGLFVSNLIGMEALSALNLTTPAIALITAISGMLATGGSAVVMKKMGEGREQEARQDFTLLILTNAVVGGVMMLLGYPLMDTLLGAMGLSPSVFGYCHTYLSNYLLFNLAMLKYIGEDGVAAITIIMYMLMFVSALFIGYSYGVAPMISYYHGEQNHEKLKKLVGFSVKFIVGASVLCTAISILATVPLVGIFTRPDSPVHELAVTGNRLCSIALLFVGLNVFASGMFTALSNGVVSAVLAFSRSFLFTVASIQIMPVLLGVSPACGWRRLWPSC